MTLPSAEFSARTVLHLEGARQAAQDARAAGDDGLLAAALRDLGHSLNRCGRPQEALEVLLEAVAFLPDDLLAQAHCWREAAEAQLALAGETEAQEYLSMALRLAREAGAQELELDVLEDIAQVQAARGDEQAAFHSLEACVAVRRGLPGSPGLARALVRLAQVRLSEAQAVNLDWLRVQHWLLEALDGLPAEDQAGRLRVEGEARAALARTALHLGQPGLACDYAQQALSLLRQVDDEKAALGVLPDLARAQQALGDFLGAWHTLEEALTHPQEARWPAERAQLHLAACEVLEARGEYSAALAHHRAYHQLDRLGRVRHERERTRAAQARVGLEATRQEARLNRERGDALERMVEARTSELVRSQRAVIDLLAGAAEFRDAPLGPHTRWVGEATTAVALELGLSSAEAEKLGLAARLHDVGKLAIPDAILLKQGPLSDQEWRVMHTHTHLGAALLTQPGAADGGPLLLLASQIALSHHESWNGGGYPQGLRGQDIPLGARIVRVVDTFDALVTERPYKPAWPEARALEYLARHAGQLCDPAVVAAFSALHARQALPGRQA